MDLKSQNEQILEITKNVIRGLDLLPPNPPPQQHTHLLYIGTLDNAIIPHPLPLQQRFNRQLQHLPKNCLRTLLLVLHQRYRSPNGYGDLGGEKCISIDAVRDAGEGGYCSVLDLYCCRRLFPSRRRDEEGGWLVNWMRSKNKTFPRGCC